MLQTEVVNSCIRNIKLLVRYDDGDLTFCDNIYSEHSVKSMLKSNPQNIRR